MKAHEIKTLLLRTEYVEKLGTGISRMRKACSDAGIPPPEFKFDDHNFAIGLRRVKQELAPAKVTDRVTDRVTEKLTDNQLKILQEMESNRYVSSSELSDKVGISVRKIKENTRKLKERGLLRRVGSPKGGHWKVLK